MLLLLAYSLMLVDAAMTLVVHEEAGELNPLWVQALEYDSTRFIYAKILVSVAISLGLLTVWRVKPETGRLATLLAILVYGSVAYLHLEVYRAINAQPPVFPVVVEWVDRGLSPQSSLTGG